MDDKELLRFAAKAAGYDIHSDAWAVKIGGGTPKLYMGNSGPEWNPLIDDGDALRLAITCKIRIDFIPPSNRPDWSVRASNNYCHQTEEGADISAATRRAIVRAAATIGAKM